MSKFKLSLKSSSGNQVNYELKNGVFVEVKQEKQVSDDVEVTSEMKKEFERLKVEEEWKWEQLEAIKKENNALECKTYIYKLELARWISEFEGLRDRIVKHADNIEEFEGYKVLTSKLENAIRTNISAWIKSGVLPTLEKENSPNKRFS